jgi:hypothetical protein
VLFAPIREDMLEDGRKDGSAVWVIQIVSVVGPMLRVIHAQFIDEALC